jgi:hypothetical protein
MSPCVCFLLNTVLHSLSHRKVAKKREKNNQETRKRLSKDSKSGFYFFFFPFLFPFVKVSLCCKVPLIIVTEEREMNSFLFEQYDRFTCDSIIVYINMPPYLCFKKDTIVCSTLIQPSSSLHRETIAFPLIEILFIKNFLMGVVSYVSARRSLHVKRRSTTLVEIKNKER